MTRFERFHWTLIKYVFSESLNVMNNNITGSLPGELWGVQSLEQLRLSNNSLRGSIPAEVGQLTKLKELTLQNNVMTGSIPPSIGALTSAGKFESRVAILTVNVLSSHVSLKIEVIDVAENRLSGSLPNELSNLVSLRKLWMAVFRFVPLHFLVFDFSGSFTASRNPGIFGSIPAEFGALTKLGTFRSRLVSTRGMNSLIEQSTRNDRNVFCWFQHTDR